MPPTLSHNTSATPVGRTRYCLLRKAPFRDLSIISQWENIKLLPFARLSMLLVSLLLHCLIIGYCWWPKCIFCLMTPRGSFEVMRGHHHMSGNNSKNKIASWNQRQCVCLIETRRFICIMTLLGHHLTLTWGQILSWPFEVTKYIIRCAVSR